MSLYFVFAFFVLRHFFFFLTAWPTLSKRFFPLFLCFLITSSKCNKPCVNLHRTKGRGGRQQPLLGTQARTRRAERELKCSNCGTVSVAGWAHSAEKASKCQSHSFLTADLMEKSCPRQSAPPAILYFYTALHAARVHHWIYFYST